MLSLVLAVLCGAFVGGLFRLTHLVHSTAGAVTPGVIAMLVAVVLLLRRAGKLVNPLVEEAQRHLKAGRRELGLQTFRNALKYKAWHPTLAGQLHTSIGMLLYANGDLDAAREELAQASSRPWESRAFLGCVHFKKRDEEPMKHAFETAVKVGKTDGLAWTVYAWCLAARGKKDDAAAVLQRGITALPADQRLKGNLEMVQAGKKMKVAPYGDRWASFQLDGSLPGVPKAARGFAQRPGFRQRPIRR